jgi:hypothetical protein
LSSEKHLFAVKMNKLPGTIYGQLKETISELGVSSNLTKNKRIKD